MAAQWINTRKATFDVVSVNTETGAIEWATNKGEAVALTAREMQAIRTKVPVKSPNMAAALDVKRWILQGLSIAQMQYNGKGHKGYGLRMLKYYHAALTPLLPKK